MRYVTCIYDEMPVDRQSVFCLHVNRTLLYFYKASLQCCMFRNINFTIFDGKSWHDYKIVFQFVFPRRWNEIAKKPLMNTLFIWYNLLTMQRDYLLLWFELWISTCVIVPYGLNVCILVHLYQTANTVEGLQSSREYH